MKTYPWAVSRSCKQSTVQLERESDLERVHEVTAHSPDITPEIWFDGRYHSPRGEAEGGKLVLV